MKFFVGVVLVALATVQLTGATLSPSDIKNKGKKVKELKTKQGPQANSVFERGLVQQEPSAKDILVENAAYHEETSLKNFNGKVLGYVTPV